MNSLITMAIPPPSLPCRHYLHADRNAFLKSEGLGRLLMEPLDGMKALHWVAPATAAGAWRVILPAESSAFSHTRCIFFQRHLSVSQDTFQDTRGSSTTPPPTLRKCRIKFGIAKIISVFTGVS